MAYNSERDDFGTQPATGSATDAAAATSGAFHPPGYDQIAAAYRQYLGREPTPEEIMSHLGGNAPNKVDYAINNIKNSQEAWEYSRRPPPEPTPAPATGGPPPTVNLGAGGGGQTAGLGRGSLLTPFTERYMPPPQPDLGGPPGLRYLPPAPVAGAPPTYQAPGYTKPPAFEYPDFQAPGAFKAPSEAEMLAEPGYQFRVREGLDALERSAAARGVLNTGGTLKDLERYGQQFASNEYGNVYNRAATAYNTNWQNAYNSYMANRGGALQRYNTNYQTQYQDPYAVQARTADINLENQRLGYNAELENRRLGYTTMAGAGERQNVFDTTNAYNQYMDRYRMQRQRQQDTYNYLSGLTGTGLAANA